MVNSKCGIHVPGFPLAGLNWQRPGWRLSHLKPLGDAPLMKVMDTWQSCHFLCILKVTHAHYTPEGKKRREEVGNGEGGGREGK